MWLALFAIYRLANHRQGPREELIKGCCFPWASPFCAANVEKSARHSVAAAPSTEVRAAVWGKCLWFGAQLWSHIRVCEVISAESCLGSSAVTSLNVMLRHDAPAVPHCQAGEIWSNIFLANTEQCAAARGKKDEGKKNASVHQSRRGLMFLDA